MKCVLHADDVERWRDLVQEVLSSSCEVESITNCDSVMPRLQQGGIDLVILDLLMPGKSPIDTGYEVMQLVRKEYPQVPVCMFTGATAGSQTDCEELSQKWGVQVVFKDDADAVQRLKAIVDQLLNADKGTKT